MRPRERPSCLGQLKSDGKQSVHYEIDELMLFLTLLEAGESGWICLLSNKYLN